MDNLEQVQAKLAKPFDNNTVKERIQSYVCQGKVVQKSSDGVPDGTEALVVSYIDARDVQERLDEAVGAFNWSFTWEPQQQDKQGRIPVKGVLTILGVTKSDVGYPNGNDDPEPLKSAVSDALKRTAILFGIGRHLYDIAIHKAPVDKYGRLKKFTAVQTAVQATTQVATQTATAAQPKPEAPQSNLLSDAQQKLIDKLTASETAKQKMAEFLAEKEVTRENLTKVQASALIDHLKK